MSTLQDSIAFSKSPTTQSPAASTEFAYATLGRGEALLPAIEVVTASGSFFPFRMLPDSGASRSVFPKRFAAPLGIDIEQCTITKVDTGNGLADQHLWPVPFKAWIVGREISLTACFGNIGVPVLGREDFFSEFFVAVDEPRRLVIVMPHS